MAVHGETPSQTVGPYFSMRLATQDRDAAMADDDTPGVKTLIVGRVFDGRGEPIEDALVEVWQANSDGRYWHLLDDGLDDGHPLTKGSFTGFGRAKTKFGDGTWCIQTIKPGRVAGPNGGLQAPHLNICLQARGVLNPLFTRMYFPDEEEANAADPILAAIPADRRNTVIALAEKGAGNGAKAYRFDMRIQGQDETALLDF